MSDVSANVSAVLERLRSGDRGAAAQLLPLVYPELRKLAAAQLHRERADHTLQPTALVNEVFLRLTLGQTVDWEGKAHFFAIAARIIRNVLVDYARSSKSIKRGGALRRVEFDEAYSYAVERNSELIALDEALDRLTVFAPRQREGVEMRFFGGLSEEEIAVVQGVSVRTVKRDWRIAKSWLHAQLSL